MIEEYASSVGPHYVCVPRTLLSPFPSPALRLAQMNTVVRAPPCLLVHRNPFNPTAIAARFISQVIVTKLSFYTTTEDLALMFSPFGVVKEARLVMDPRTRRHRGYGFVTFETETEAQKAIKALDGRIVKGRMVFVEFAKPRTEEGKDRSGHE